MKQKNEAIKQAFRYKLAESLKSRLTASNITQKQAASYTGITASEISRILNGKINIGIDTLAVIDKVFELKILNNE
jgi:transcriptional regulator with XRE-family HTH domain